MSSVQFWERCLKSRFFLSAAGVEVPASHPEDRLFDALTRSAPAPTLGSLASHVDADLTGEYQREKAAERKNALVSRLNERSAALLSEKLAKPAKLGDLEGDLAKRRLELRDSAELLEKDLTQKQPRAQVKLDLKEAGSLPVHMGTKGLKKRPAPCEEQKLKRWVCNNRCAVSEPGARWVLKVSTDELLAAERLNAQKSIIASEDALKASSLLKHFWSSKCSERELRQTLCREITKVLTMQEKEGSMAFLPALRRALALHQQERGGSSLA